MRNPLLIGMKKSVQHLYERYTDEGPRHKNTIFRSIDRLKLTADIVQNACPDGAGLKLSEMIADKDHPATSFFPMHEQVRLASLQERFSIWDLPIASLRSNSPK